MISKTQSNGQPGKKYFVDSYLLNVLHILTLSAPQSFHSYDVVLAGPLYVTVCVTTVY